jgi:hypothetical protein
VETVTAQRTDLQVQVDLGWNTDAYRTVRRHLRPFILLIVGEERLGHCPTP